MIIIIEMVDLRKTIFSMKEKIRLKYYEKKVKFLDYNREKNASKRENQSSQLRFG